MNWGMPWVSTHLFSPPEIWTCDHSTSFNTFPCVRVMQHTDPQIAWWDWYIHMHESNEWYPNVIDIGRTPRLFLLRAQSQGEEGVSTHKVTWRRRREEEDTRAGWQVRWSLFNMWLRGFIALWSFEGEGINCILHIPGAQHADRHQRGGVLPTLHPKRLYVTSEGFWRWGWIDQLQQQRRKQNRL